MSASAEGRRGKATPQFIQAGHQAAAAWREDVAQGRRVRASRKGEPVFRYDGAKLRLFAQAVAKGKNLTRAAIAAGAPEKVAPGVGMRWNRRADAQEMIEEECARLEEARAKTVERVLIPTREDVLRDILEVRDEAKRTKNQAIRMKANELIGKELGMFVNRSEVAISSALDAMPASVLIEWRRAVEAASIGASVVDVDDEDHNLLAIEGLDEAEDDPLA
jgi:hypothetical protein